MNLEIMKIIKSYTLRKQDRLGKVRNFWYKIAHEWSIYIEEKIFLFLEKKGKKNLLCVKLICSRVYTLSVYYLKIDLLTLRLCLDERIQNVIWSGNCTGSLWLCRLPRGKREASKLDERLENQ